MFILQALHFPPALYDHVTTELNKPMILILNKTDLAPPGLVVAWRHYFQKRFPKLHVVCFTSHTKLPTNNEHSSDVPGEKITKIFNNKIMVIEYCFKVVCIYIYISHAVHWWESVCTQLCVLARHLYHWGTLCFRPTVPRRHLSIIEIICYVRRCVFQCCTRRSGRASVFPPLAPESCVKLVNTLYREKVCNLDCLLAVLRINENKVDSIWMLFCK